VSIVIATSSRLPLSIVFQRSVHVQLLAVRRAVAVDEVLAFIPMVSTTSVSPS